MRTVIAAAAIALGLAGCVAEPANDAYYPAPAYAPAYPAYAEPSVGIGSGFDDGVGWRDHRDGGRDDRDRRGDHDRDDDHDGDHDHR